MNNFFDPKSDLPMFKNTNLHFLDLESKLRPLRQRPDSAFNPGSFKGLTMNDSNISTSATVKQNDSYSNVAVAVEKRKKRTTEDVLIDYFQGIVDNIKNKFVYYKDKQSTVINFEQLEALRPGAKPVITNLSQPAGKFILTISI
jgi:hypothetical protein